MAAWHTAHGKNLGVPSGCGALSDGDRNRRNPVPHAIGQMTRFENIKPDVIQRIVEAAPDRAPATGLPMASAGGKAPRLKQEEAPP
jgi:hypothetical protein